MSKLKLTIILLIVILTAFVCGDGGDNDGQAVATPSYTLQNQDDTKEPTAARPIKEY